MTKVSVEIRRVRVTYLVSRAAARIPQIGDPDAFEVAMVSRSPIRGLDITLPWLPGSGDPSEAVNERFWAKVVDVGRLAAPRSVAEAAKLRRKTVPLRHAARLQAERVRSPRLEIHLRPFGWVALVTVDVSTETAWDGDQFLQELSALEHLPVRVDIGTSSWDGPLAEAAPAAVDLLDRLFERPGEAWSTETYRLLTLIDAEATPASTGMPTSGSALHQLLHRLSGGSPPPADPAGSFVPRFDGFSGFLWDPGSLNYVLSHGMAMFVASHGAAPRLNESAATRHRRLVLLASHIAASGSLLRIARGTSDPFIRDWGGKAADRMGRLFGPDRPGEDYWGLEGRRIICALGIAEDAEAIRGKPLDGKSPEPQFT